MSNRPFFCSYCGNPVREKYAMSLGIPGVRQTIACDREWCRLTLQSGPVGEAIHAEQMEQLGRIVKDIGGFGDDD